MTRYRRFAVKRKGGVIESPTGAYVRYRDVETHEFIYGNAAAKFLETFEENHALKAEVKILRERIKELESNEPQNNQATPERGE